MVKKFYFKNLGNLLLNESHYNLLINSGFIEKLKDFDKLENYFKLIFFRKKHYRVVKAFQMNEFKLFIKKYEKNLKEAESEWKNISLLWKKGFPTSIPVFFYKNSSIALIGTEAIPGKMCLEIIKENPEKTQEIIKKIAQFLGNFHKNKLFHQDCYLNHFYWDEENNNLYMLDVSRVLNNSCLSFYYQIKDLSQLKFSFFSYFPEHWNILWNFFVNEYEKELDFKLNKFKKIYLLIKFYQIKRHTQKLNKNK